VSQATALMDFRNVTVIRGTTVALNRLSLTIGAHENVAIIGPNGCGKSTLLKTITRELYPIAEDGSYARILGRDRWEVTEMRKHLGVVTNDLFAQSHRNPSGRELVLSGFFSSFGLWPHHHVTPEMERKTDEVLALLGASHLAAKPYNELSSGERKRLVLGRALVHGPQALVLDEPSDSLDLAALKALQTNMRTLAQSGISIALVTHHLHEIIPEISRVVLMKDGRVFRDGSKAEILTRANLSEAYGADIEPMERDGYYQFW
jgi:iron complex transport system ATP-binding protein